MQKHLVWGDYKSLAKDFIIVKSAGSQPAGEVHPLSIRYLAKTGYSTQGLISQSWNDFENFEPDIVVTVCDSAAGEACPLYLGNSLKIHWGLNDPSKVRGSELKIEQAFLGCIEEITERVKKLVNIAKQNLDQAALRQALIEAGAQ